MRLIFPSLTAALISCAFSTSWAANTITPQNGNWIISNELTGKPGRGMGIDVQDGIFVMQVYNYRQDGSATFHLATGSINDNKVVAPLKEYKNGPFFGSSPRNGTETANAGEVKIEFTSRTTATIQFPGEEIKEMHRFNYEGTPATQFADNSYIERWAIVEMDEKNQPTKTYWADIGLGSKIALNPRTPKSWPFASSENFTIYSYDQGTNYSPYSFLECDTPNTDLISICQGQKSTPSNTGTQSAKSTWHIQRSLDELQGIITDEKGNSRKILGSRVEKAAYSINNNSTVTSQLFRRDSLPEAGTWIVSTELNGQAGRGISLDVQKINSGLHTLFMPIYNYAKNGNATFHLGFATHSPSTIPESQTPYVPLDTYKNGRYFGSTARDAQFNEYAGQASISFQSTATGTIQFPDENPLRIQRYYFGVNPENTKALIGTWAMVPYDGMLTPRIFNFKYADSGIVADAESGYTCVVNYWLSYRYLCSPKNLSADYPKIRIATGFYGVSRAIMDDGGPLPDSTPELAVMRILDAKGNPVFGGPLYPSNALDEIETSVQN